MVGCCKHCHQCLEFGDQLTKCKLLQDCSVKLVQISLIGFHLFYMFLFINKVFGHHMMKVHRALLFPQF